MDLLIFYSRVLRDRNANKENISIDHRVVNPLYCTNTSSSIVKGIDQLYRRADDTVLT